MNKKICIISLAAASTIYAADSYKLDNIGVEYVQPKQELASDVLKVTVLPDESSQTLSTVLKNEPFVQTRGAGSFGSEIYIRGRGLNGVPVYYGGMQINQAHGDSTNIISLADVDSIEVTRGPAGAELGNHGTTGAVIIKDKKPVFLNKDGYEVGGQASYSQSVGALSAQQGSFKAELTSKDIYIGVYGSQAYSGAYKNGDGTEVKHSDEDRQNGGIKLGVNLKDKGTLVFKVERSIANAADASSRTKVGNTYSFTDKPDNTLDYYMLRYEIDKLGILDKLTAEAFYADAKYNIFTEYESASPVYISAAANTKQLFRKSDTGGGKIEAFKALDDHALKASLTYQHTNISNGLRNYTASHTWSQWTNAPGIKGGNEDSRLFAISDSITKGANKIELAASYENVKREIISNVATNAWVSAKKDTDKTDSLLSFSAKYGYELSKAFVPYAKISKNERLPYFNETYGNTPNGTQIPNQDLKNEKVWNYELGFDGKIGAASYGASTYYSKYKDYVELQLTGVTVSGTPQKQYKNLDSATIYGFEAWGEYNVWQDYSIGGTFNYTYGKNEDINAPLAYISPAIGSVKISKKSAKIGVFGEIEQVFAATQSRISSAAGETSTSGYGVTNMNVGYKFANLSFVKEPSLKLEVNNLFNKNYRMHLTTPSTSLVRAEEPGMYAIASLSAKF